VSVADAALFGWVQSAPAYTAVHREAVHLLPAGAGGTWLDVGCGPGLVARLAARHGYRSVGIDRDPAMVRAARRRTPAGARCTFLRASLDEFAGTSDVVSAASLVCQLPDPAAALCRLWELVAAGGALLVVETTPAMTTEHIATLTATLDGRSRRVLTRWARARSGHAIAVEAFGVLPEPSEHVLLLGDAVRVVVVRKPA